MSDDLVKQSIAELQDLVRCRCHEAYKGRGLHDPDCHCDTAEAVKVVADRIEELEARHANDCEEIAKWREIVSGRTIGENFEVVWRERLKRSEANLAKAVMALQLIEQFTNTHDQRAIADEALAELKGQDDA